MRTLKITHRCWRERLRRISKTIYDKTREIHRWDENGVGMLEKMEFVWEIQKEKGLEDHNIEMLLDKQMAQLHSAAKHWAKIVDDPVVPEIVIGYLGIMPRHLKTYF